MSVIAMLASPAFAQSRAELVDNNCGACHSTQLIERSMGYTVEGWRALIDTMIELDTEDAASIAAHLGAIHPPSERRAPTLIAGPVELDWQAWSGPTLGQRARDPVEAPDGAIWWTGQWADIVTRLDPASGEMIEIPLPAGAHAHTVTADAKGRIWYTGNGNGTMGVIDPETEEITEYPMPDPDARDPHSAIVAADGRVFFTLQHSNMAGRLDPATGEVDLVTMPVAGSRPYGIKLTPDDSVWVAANGAPRLYRLDPDTLAVEEHPVSEKGTTIRRLAIAEDGTIWYVNSSLGRLGHYDPATGENREWPSPSGPDSHPYAIALIDGVVWYNESGKRPDALVRFDPATERFQSWAIPSGDIVNDPVYAGIVRHMRPTRDGGLLIHQSATNTILKVTVKPGN